MKENIYKQIKKRLNKKEVELIEKGSKAFGVSEEDIISFLINIGCERVWSIGELRDRVNMFIKDKDKSKLKELNI